MVFSLFGTMVYIDINIIIAFYFLKLHFSNDLIETDKLHPAYGKEEGTPLCISGSVPITSS